MKRERENKRERKRGRERAVPADVSRVASRGNDLEEGSTTGLGHDAGDSVAGMLGQLESRADAVGVAKVQAWIDCAKQRRMVKSCFRNISSGGVVRWWWWV